MAAASLTIGSLCTRPTCGELLITPATAASYQGLPHTPLMGERHSFIAAGIVTHCSSYTHAGLAEHTRVHNGDRGISHSQTDPSPPNNSGGGLCPHENNRSPNMADHPQHLQSGESRDPLYTLAYGHSSDHGLCSTERSPLRYYVQLPLTDLLTVLQLPHILCFTSSLFVTSRLADYTSYR